MITPKRISHIDLLKSIAIFFVITYHSTLYLHDIIRDNSLSTYLLYFSRTILSTCVPLFFFTNGYLLLNKDFDLKKHIKKIFRLIILILIWSFLLMLFYMFIADEPIKIKTIILCILNLDTSWSMNFFWFLGALICIYILFPPLKALFDQDKKSFCFFTFACAMLTFGFVLGEQVLSFVSTVSHHNFGRLNYPLLTMFNPFRGAYGYSFVYFCAGGLIYTYENKIMEIPKWKRTLVSTLGILISCICLFGIGVYYTKFVDKKAWDVVWNGYDTVFTFFNVVFIYTLCLNYTQNNTFTKSISRNTLGIYLTHELIIRLTFPWITAQSALCNLPFNILYAFMITFVCLLICVLLRKIPILKRII